MCHALHNSCHRNYMNIPDISTNTHVQIGSAIFASYETHAILCLSGFLCIRGAGHTGIKITEGMLFYLLNWQVESQLAVAEEITFPYVWGTYDLLILPPSFPYGGMENPCLTFVTPTLLVGEGVRCLSINILLYCLELLVCCTVCH